MDLIKDVFSFLKYYLIKLFESSILTEVTSGVILFGILYFLYERKKNRAALRQQLHAFPFEEKTSDQLVNELDREHNTFKKIDFIDRSPTNSVFSEIKKARKVLVTGRPGIGKTRECKEAIRRLDEMASDQLTVFTARYGSDMFIGQPQTRELLGAKRPILFIDDIDQYFRAGLSHDAQKSGLEDFDHRFQEAVDWFVRQNENTIVIVTAQDRSFIKKYSTVGNNFWNEFKEICVPDIHQEVLRDLINSLQKTFRISLDEKAKKYLVKLSDHTFQGVIDSFYKIATEYQNTTKELSVNELQFLELPLNWNETYLKKELKENDEYRAIFEILGALRKIRVPSFQGLVLSCVSRTRRFFFRSYCRRKLGCTIDENLKKWINTSEDNLFVCPEIYIRELGDIAKISKVLAPSISELPVDQQEKIICDSYNIYDRLRKETEGTLLAIRFLKALFRRFPQNLFVCNALYFVYLNKGNFKQLLPVAKRLVRISRNTASLHRLSLAFGKQAESQSGNRKIKFHKSALKYAEEAIKIDPLYAPAYKSMAINYYQLGDIDQSLKYAKLTVSVRGSSRDLYALAVAYGQMGMFDKAVETARKSIALDPNFIPARESLIINLSEMSEKKLEEADALQDLVEKTNDKSHWEQLWAVLTKINEYGQAEVVAKKLVKQYPSEQKYKNLLFSSLQYQDKYREAQQYGTIDTSYQSQFDKTLIKEVSKSWVAAVTFIRLELAKTPQDYEKWNILGANLRKYVSADRETLNKSGQDHVLLEEAIMAHDKALLLVPSSISGKKKAAVWYAKGLVYAELQEYKKAYEAYGKALALCPYYEKPKMEQAKLVKRQLVDASM
jgi:tetratricopeptide (TPR) repeat protein